MEHLQAEEWKSRLEASDDAVIIDVRTPEEWSEGIIEGALKQNIHEQQEFMDFVEKLDKAKSYFVYCRSGARSGNACAYMNSLGFEKAYNLAGGILNWPFEVKR